MDIGLRRPDLPLELEHSKPSPSFGIGHEFADVNEMSSICEVIFLLSRIPVCRAALMGFVDCYTPMIYRRKKRDPAAGLLVETGPHWMKYYVEGRPIQESTRTLDQVEAKRLLKEKEGEVATGLYRGPKIEHIRFEDLAALVKQDYQINKRKTVRRVDEYMSHLKTFFKQMRAISITTERIKTYIVNRQHHGTANGTINR